jgi:hypothetical protein
MNAKKMKMRKIMNQFESTEIARKYQRRIAPINYEKIFWNICFFIFGALMLVAFVTAVIDLVLEMMK